MVGKRQSSSGSSSSFANEENQKLRCSCGNYAVVRSVKKGPNSGMKFYNCPLWPDTKCEMFRWVNQSNPMEDLQYHVLEKETRICELEYKQQCKDDKIKRLQLKKDNLEEDVQEMKNEVYAMHVEMMNCSRNEKNLSMALVFSWIFFAVVLFYLNF
uniref:GRF-type domain-containing protein n=1 Tax=Chenopodium quinoa TaxID=63459 RepID=A0A803M6I6_CHEQI